MKDNAIVPQIAESGNPPAAANTRAASDIIDKAAAELAEQMVDNPSAVLTTSSGAQITPVEFPKNDRDHAFDEATFAMRLPDKVTGGIVMTAAINLLNLSRISLVHNPEDVPDENTPDWPRIHRYMHKLRMNLIRAVKAGVLDGTLSPGDDGSERAAHPDDPHVRWFVGDIPTGTLYLYERNIQTHIQAGFELIPLDDAAWARYAALCDQMGIPDNLRRCPPTGEQGEDRIPTLPTIPPAPVGVPIIHYKVHEGNLPTELERWLSFHLESGMFSFWNRPHGKKDELHILTPTDAAGWQWYSDMCDRVKLPTELRRRAPSPAEG